MLKNSVALAFKIFSKVFMTFFMAFLFSCSMVEDALNISSPSIKVDIVAPSGEPSEEFDYRKVSDIAQCRADFYRDSARIYSSTSSGCSSISHEVGAGNYAVYVYAYDKAGTSLAIGENHVSVSNGEKEIKIQLFWKKAVKSSGEYATVSFDTNGGSLISQQKVLSGSTVSKPANPTRFGYAFDDWYISSDFSSIFSFSTAITYNRTLYAKWIPSYSGNEFYVSSSGSDETGLGTEAAPFATLQKAIAIITNINDSSVDYVIYISGTVTGTTSIQSTFAANSLLITGKTNAASDILDGNSSGTVLTINTAIPVTVKNVTVQNGSSFAGGGFYINSNAQVILEDIIIKNNDGGSAYSGGGIYNKGNLSITNGEISSNTAGANGGGIYQEGGTLNLSNTIIQSNTAGINGGGIYLKSTSLNFGDGSISSNTAQENGGGIYSEGTLTILGGFISNNTGDMGGGIYTTGSSSSLVMKSGNIVGNTALRSGGGIWLGSTFIMEGGIIGGSNSSDANIAGNNSGGAVMVGLNTFTMKDDAYIPYGGEKGKNDVLVYSSYPLRIAGSLSGASPVATITPATYTSGTTVLAIYSGAETTVADEYKKFAVSDDGTTSWFITSGGSLFSLDSLAIGTVTIDGTTYTKLGVDSADTLINIFMTLNSDSSIDTSEFCIALTSDITLPDSYMPFGYDSETGTTDGSISFNGVFDGQGHTLTVGDMTSSQYTPLCFWNNGIIQNLKITLAPGKSITANNGSATGYTDFAGICTENSGIIRNCWVDLGEVHVNLWLKTSGISAGNTGTIENCINTTNFICSYNQSNWSGVWGLAGGICGVNDGTIKNCVNYGQITIATTYSSGTSINGLSGAITGKQSGGTTQNCYWRENCLYTNSAQTTTANYQVYNSTISGIREGTFTGNGYFANNTNGSLTAGNTTTSVTAQSLEYGSALLSALNSYVSASTDSANLKTWISNGSYAAVLDF